MSTCAMCGHDDGNGRPCCIDGRLCNQRELANLRYLLRSVTRRLENARELAAEGDMKAVDEIDAVLEALS